MSPHPNKILTSCTIQKQSGVSFKLLKGQFLKVTDVSGQQVADLYCIDSNNLKNHLSSGRSIDYQETNLFSRGNVLISSDGDPMLKIVSDTCGRHDFLVTPCSQQMFNMMNNSQAFHPSCEENLTDAFRSSGIEVERIGTTFNIFMNVEFDLSGKIRVCNPISQPGDYIVFESLMDLQVALTACSDEGTNAGCCKPVSFEILCS